MISIKNDGKTGTHTKVKGMQPEILLAIIITNELLSKMFKRDLTLTSVTDSHQPPSFHPEGLAFDMRTWGMSWEDKTRFKKELENLLGGEYDVVIEGTHIHVEFDPPIEVEEELSPINLTNEETQALLKETYEDEERFGEEESSTRLRRIDFMVSEILRLVTKGEE